MFDALVVVVGRMVEGVREIAEVVAIDYRGCWVTNCEC